MKTIGVISQKGGSGKTTLAIHLAVAAHQAGQQAVLADLDEQASATQWHQSRSESMPYVQPTHSASLAQTANAAANEGVDVLVLDTAPQSNQAAMLAAQISDVILIPCRPSVMDLRAIQNTLRLTEIAELKPDIEIRVVLTLVDSFGRLHEEAQQALSELGVQVLPIHMGRRVAYHHGLINGRTALEFDPRGKAADETRRIYEEVCKLNSGHLTFINQQAGYRHGQ